MDEEVIIMNHPTKSKIKELQLKMMRYADTKKKPLPNGDYVLPGDWSEDFKLTLQLERLDTLNKEQKKLANKLYRKYLGFVK